MSGRHGGHDDEVELGRADPAPLEGLARRPGRELARGGARLDVVALLDPGARPDPLVGGVDDLLEVGVGHDPLGHVAPERRDRAPVSGSCGSSLLVSLLRHARVTRGGESDH